MYQSQTRLMSKPYIFSPPCWPSSPPPPTLPPHPFPPILRCYPPFSSLNSMPVSDAMSSSLIFTAAAATSPLLHLGSGPSCNNHATPQRPTPPSTAPCMLPLLRPSPPSLFCVNLGATYPALILILSLISNTLRFCSQSCLFFLLACLLHLHVRDIPRDHKFSCCLKVFCASVQDWRRSPLLHLVGDMLEMFMLESCSSKCSLRCYSRCFSYLTYDECLALQDSAPDYVI